MQTMHGFSLQWEKKIPELNLEAFFYTHDKTGAELLSLVNDDANKTFGISFRTPPEDSTGVAHILEHSVLCGSRKYPSKEPFVELLKGSLQTFLNAMTYPDKTCYPVASQNLQDFYNLIDVYLDAVLHPRITRHIFEQEGWHYELDDLDAPLTYKGVVYNEMKGAYSSPDSLLAEYSQQSLFPDTTYGLDSGGHPEHIPDLTFEAFTRFHRTYYHPSNARIFFAGDDPPHERLRIAAAFLDEFERLDVDSSVSLQPAFDKPRRIEQRYDASEGEGRSLVTVNWMLGTSDDPEKTIALQILEEALIGMPASPLRKALIDSEMGEDLAGVGLEDELRQFYFSTGLKGVKPGSEDKVEQLVLETLRSLAAEGIDPKTVEAALNSVEFRYRENNTGSYPQSLLLMLRALTTWLHGADPTALLAFEQPFERIKHRLDSGEPLFEDLIRSILNANSHRTTVVLKPDTTLAAEREEREKSRLAAIKEACSKEELETILENTQTLKLLQSQPDSPEDLATIPRLNIGDLDPVIQTIPSKEQESEQGRMLVHELPTNGITYLDVGFDLTRLPLDLLSHVPLFGKALLEMGTSREDYVSLSQRISRTTGGIHAQTATSALQERKAGGAWLFLRGKATYERTDDLLHILKDVLCDVRLNDKQRFLQLVLEEKADLEQRLIPAGHQVVNARLRARYNPADLANEHMEGVTQLLFLRRLADAVRRDWPSVLSRLETVRSLLVARNSLVTNLTAATEMLPQVVHSVRDFLGALPQGETADNPWPLETFPDPEGLTLPAQVNYVGAALDLYSAGYMLHGSALVICRYLRTSWLWEKVRVQGGAYGAFSLFDRLSGILTFLSYRDPNLGDTLKIFEQAADFLLRTELHDDEVTKAVVGSIGDMDKYMLPDTKGFTACIRQLVGDTDQNRQKLRDEILSTTNRDFKDFATVLKECWTDRSVAVLGSSASLEKARDKGLGFETVQRLL